MALILTAVSSQAMAAHLPPDGLNLYYDLPSKTVIVELVIPVSDQDPSNCDLMLQWRYQGVGWLSVKSGYASSRHFEGHCLAYGQFTIRSLRRTVKYRPVRLQGFLNNHPSYTRRLTKSMLRNPEEYMNVSTGGSG